MRRVYTALVTPFYRGRVDFDSLYKLVERQNKSNVAGMVVLGTTGEGVLLEQKEKNKVLAFVRASTSKVVIAGISEIATANCTRQASSYCQLGADALLVATPYYVGCSQKGLVSHFKRVQKACNLPVILYNVPHRTGFDVDVDSVVKIGNEIDLAGVKECSENLQKLSLYRQRGIEAWCGNDGLMSQFERAGFDRAISVVSNLCPNLFARSVTSKVASRLAGLCATSNPAAVKYALYCMGLIQSYKLRCPLLPPNDLTKGKILKFVQQNLGEIV